MGGLATRPSVPHTIVADEGADRVDNWAPETENVPMRSSSRERLLPALISAWLLLTAPGTPALASSGFAWQSLSFDGGVDPLLSGPISGTISGTPVPSDSLVRLENTGVDFHLRWSSPLASHLALRFSVGYASFAPSMGFEGLSTLPLTVGFTVPLFDPRVSTAPVIPYLAADVGPSFNSLASGGGNVGSVSFTGDFGAGVLLPLSRRFSLYGEVLPTLISGPVSSDNPQVNTSVTSGILWSLPVLIGITYNFSGPRAS